MGFPFVKLAKNWWCIQDNFGLVHHVMDLLTLLLSEWPNSMIVGLICDIFWANCALFDKSMKFGT